MIREPCRTRRAPALLHLLLAAVAACTTGPPPRTSPPPTVAPPTSPPATTAGCLATHPRLCDFFEFAGLRYGDTRADVERLLGPADRIDHNDGSDGGRFYDWIELIYYRDPSDLILGDLRINLDKATDRVRKISVNSQAGVQRLRSAGVDDPKLLLYNAHSDHLPDLYGPPEIHAGFHRYRFRDDAGRVGSIHFLCHHQDLCDEIWLHWYHPARAVATTAARRPSPPPPTPPATTPSAAAASCLASHPRLCDFFDFAGLHYGDTRSDVERLLGPPDRIEPHDGSDGSRVIGWMSLLYYRDQDDRILGDLKIDIDKATDRVRWIGIENRAGMWRLHAAGGDDPKLLLYGAHRDEIFDRYGPPDHSDAGFHDYDFHDDAGRRGQISFICYDFRDDRCEELWLYWFY